MKQQKLVLSTIALTGTLALGLSPVWAQSSSAETNSGSKVESSQSHNRPTPYVGHQQPTRAQSRSTGEPFSSQSKEGAYSARQGQSSARWQRGDIKEAQEALKAKGNDPGPIDGIMGPQTREALRNFQQSQGLQATGRLNAETAKALGIENGNQMESSQSHNRPTPYVGHQRPTPEQSRSSGVPFSRQPSSSQNQK